MLDADAADITLMPLMAPMPPRFITLMLPKAALHMFRCCCTFPLFDFLHTLIY